MKMFLFCVYESALRFVWSRAMHALQKRMQDITIISYCRRQSKSKFGNITCVWPPSQSWIDHVVLTISDTPNQIGAFIMQLSIIFIQHFHYFCFYFNYFLLWIKPILNEILSNSCFSSETVAYKSKIHHWRCQNTLPLLNWISENNCSLCRDN